MPKLPNYRAFYREEYGAGGRTIHSDSTVYPSEGTNYQVKSSGVDIGKRKQGGPGKPAYRQSSVSNWRERHKQYTKNVRSR